MPSISKELAEKEIERLKNKKRPKVYCIVNYQNRTIGDSAKGTYSGYAICYKPRDYEALLQSPVVGGVDILWSSKRFDKDWDIEEAKQEERLVSEILSLPVDKETGEILWEKVNNEEADKMNVNKIDDREVDEIIEKTPRKQ